MGPGYEAVGAGKGSIVEDSGAEEVVEGALGRAGMRLERLARREAIWLEAVVEIGAAKPSASFPVEELPPIAVSLSFPLLFPFPLLFSSLPTLGPDATLFLTKTPNNRSFPLPGPALGRGCNASSSLRASRNSGSGSDCFTATM